MRRTCLETALPDPPHFDGFPSDKSSHTILMRGTRSKAVILRDFILDASVSLPPDHRAPSASCLLQPILNDVVARDLQGPPEEPHTRTPAAPLWHPDHDPQVRCAHRRPRYTPIPRSPPVFLHRSYDED
jgi:hypothetical protein